LLYNWDLTVLPRLRQGFFRGNVSSVKVVAINEIGEKGIKVRIIRSVDLFETRLCGVKAGH
jgi:hypothetical protein